MAVNLGTTKPPASVVAAMQTTNLEVVTSKDIANLQNTITKNTSINDTVSRSFNAASVSNNLRDLGSNISSAGDLANKLLGGDNSVAKVLNQASSAVGAINKIGGLLNSAKDLTRNSSELTGAVSDALTGKSFKGISNSGKTLDSLKSAIEKGDVISAFNEVTVVNRSEPELAGVAEIQSARQFMESYKPDISNLPLSTSDSSGESYTVNQGGRIENPLRGHNSVNYIITLGILDANQLNNPTSYRKNGASFKKVLLRAGGGQRESGYANRIRTYAEGEEDAEYYIEDLELGSVVSPNPNTSVSLGTNISFNIIEPFSMGKFIEAMIVGSEECGYSSYIDAPFCLKIEFLGWDERGERDVSLAKPSYIPLKINKMEFNIGDQGSTYACTAVPFSEAALSDVANKTRVPVSPSGSTVAEILELSKDSVTNTLNGQIEKLEDKNVVKEYDRYIICFPKDKQSLMKAIEAANVNLEGLKATSTPEEQERIRLGVAQPVVNPDPDFKNQNVPTVNSTAPNTFLYLKTWASDVKNMNLFGLSSIASETRDGGDQPHPTAGSVVDNDTRTVRTSSPSAAPAEKSRKFQFNDGCNITDIIEEVILNSTYAKELSVSDSKNGMKTWFRVETMTFIEPNSTGAEASIGRPRKTYVYAVHPFETHEARHLGPCQNPRSIEELKAGAKKEYNYYYTGQNEDVLDFQINFNNAFFQNIRADAGQNSSVGLGQQVTATGAGQPSGTQVAETGERACPASNDGEQKSSVELTAQDKSVSTGGTRVGTVDDKRKLAIAENFHSRLINSPADMVTGEIVIWGDPYYIPSDVGNYSSASSDSSVTEDGTMDYMRNEVHIIINFRTTLDYLINGSTMNFPSYVKPFSGVYQVTAVTSSFSSGQFKQTLQLIRMPGQNGSDNETTNGSGVLQLADGTKSTVSDPMANANPNPEAAPVAPPQGTVTPGLASQLNTDKSTGSSATFSQERLMAVEETEAPEIVVVAPRTSIANLLSSDPIQVPEVPLDLTDRYGIVADLRTTVFPLKLSDVVNNLSNVANTVSTTLTEVNNLRQKGLNIPKSADLPISLISAALSPNFTNETANRIQTTVNNGLSNLSTQARPLGTRPPTI